MSLRGCRTGDLWYVWPTLLLVLYADGWSVEICWLNWAIVFDHTRQVQA
jgi:hypothetical protein